MRDGAYERLHSKAAKVVDLSAARAKKAAATTRWGLFAAAAAVALLVGGGGAQYAATRMPPTTVTYATVGSPPSPWELAAPARRRALRACALGYYGECQDLLDEAQKIDPEGENNARGPGRSFGHCGQPSGQSLRQAADRPEGKAAPAAPLMGMNGTFRPRNAVMRGRNGTMQAYGRVGATDDGAHPARHRGDATHGRAGREERSGQSGQRSR